MNCGNIEKVYRKYKCLECNEECTRGFTYKKISSLIYRITIGVTIYIRDDIFFKFLIYRIDFNICYSTYLLCIEEILDGVYKIL